MKFECTTDTQKLKKILNTLASDDDLINHLGSFDISYCQETLKVHSYKISILTKDPALIQKIVSVLEEE